MTARTPPKAPWELLIGFGGLAVFAIVFAVLGDTGWFGGTQQHIATGVVPYCETPRGGMVEQPVNTFSNLGPIIIGLVLLGMIWHDQQRVGGRNRLTKHTTYARVFAFTTLFLGPGSMMYHGSLTYWGGWFDNMSMFFVITFMLVYTLTRVFDWSKLVFLLVYWITVLVLGVTLAIVIAVAPQSEFGAITFGVLVAAAIITELVAMFLTGEGGRRRFQQQQGWFWTAIGLFAASAVVWYLSWTENAWCVPDSFWQGHMFWHIGTGLAVLSVYLYYRSETSDT